MPVLRVVLLWHQHQPFYKNLVTGEYRLPWVRLHALKDYYGMVKLLDEFPRVHQNFNLVPSLITQIQDYVAGTAQDPFLYVAARPARDLSPDERRFALQYLFQANPVNLIGRYPRYRELWERFRSAGDSPERAEKFFQPQDFTDLQVLSQIAWFDEFFLEDKDIAALVRKERNYSLEDQRFVIQRERELLGQVLPAHAAAAKKGSIEISTSPFYHPILPLLCDTNVGAVSSPNLPLPQNRFRHPEDARDQILRGLDLHEEVFGIRPQGMWPSEGSVSEEAIAIAHESGVRWMATDEGILGRTTGQFFVRQFALRLGSLCRILLVKRARMKKVIPRAVILGRANPDVEIRRDPRAGKDRSQTPKVALPLDRLRNRHCLHPSRFLQRIVEAPQEVSPGFRVILPGILAIENDRDDCILSLIQNRLSSFLNVLDEVLHGLCRRHPRIYKADEVGNGVVAKHQVHRG